MGPRMVLSSFVVMYKIDVIYTNDPCQSRRCNSGSINEDGRFSGRQGAQSLYEPVLKWETRGMGPGWIRKFCLFALGGAQARMPNCLGTTHIWFDNSWT
jgi:hypothetical protein